MIDCHSHLSFLSAEMVELVILEAEQMGLNRWVMGGYDHRDWEKQILLKKTFNNKIYTCFGLHPWKILELSSTVIQQELSELNNSLSSAQFIGEIGLDFFIKSGKDQSDKQEECFRSQLEMGKGKAFVFHIVQAHSKAMEILNDYPQCRGFIHGFSGSYEVAKSYINKNILISIGPSILNPNFKKLREALQHIEIKHLLIESDSPEGPGDSSYALKSYFQVASEVARIKGLEVQELLKEVTINFEKMNHG